MSKQDDLERRAIQLIVTKRNEGILQCDLWRELDSSSREGSRLSLKLEKKNIIRREKEIFNGRWTYRVFIKKRPIEIDSVLDVPCVSCSDISKCEAGSEVTPNLCIKLTRWLLSIKEKFDESESTD